MHGLVPCTGEQAFKSFHYLLQCVEHDYYHILRVAYEILIFQMTEFLQWRGSHEGGACVGSRVSENSVQVHRRLPPPHFCVKCKKTFLTNSPRLSMV